MRHISSVLAAALLALPLAAPLAAQSAPAPNPWPREVQAIFDGYKAQCLQAGGKFVPDLAGFARPVEVTGDGKADWVVEDSAFECRVSQAQMDAGNYPETGSGFCGTAGCQLTILGSGRKGLAPIFQGNLRDWKVVELGGGRKGIETSVHGSACGGFGAEVCMETLAWNGRKWDLVKRYRWTDADYDADQRRQAALPPYQEPPGHDAKWVFAGQGGSAIAAVSSHPELGTLGLRCQPGGGIYLTLVPPPRSALRLPPSGRPLLLSFEGSTEGITADQQVVQEPGKPDWSGSLVPPLEALLGGRDDGLSVLASADGGVEWQNLAYFSLAGSTRALQSLQRQCAGAQGAAASAAATGMVTVAPLGIVAGYYVEEAYPCSAPGFEAFFYDGKRFGLMRGGGRGTENQNFLGPIGKVTRQAGEFYLEDWSMTIRVLSPTRIQPTIQDTGPPMRWCSAEQMSPGFRAR